jgi:hypothetical protein
MIADEERLASVAPLPACSYHRLIWSEPAGQLGRFARPEAPVGGRPMQRFQAVFGATMIVLAAAAAIPARAENVLRWASATEALTFDPHAVPHVPTLVETSQVYESLVGFNSRYEIEPSLAVAWHLIDPTTWQFDLRQGTFS